MTTLRREFDLLPIDREFLDVYGMPWETIVDASQWVLIHDFPALRDYNRATVTAAIRIETGCPNTELNMVYFFPALARIDGKPIGATEAQQHPQPRVRWGSEVCTRVFSAEASESSGIPHAMVATVYTSSCVFKICQNVRTDP
jgi:Prokaryotic E2 family E